MKNNKKLAGAVVSFATAAVTLIGGTYAWFVSGNNASATFEGSMSSVAGVKIGIVAAKDTVMGANFETAVALDEDNSIFYTTSNEGLVQADINKACGIDDTFKFTPVTTGSYAENDAIVLYKAPDAYNINTQHDEDYEVAPNTSYVQFTLAFLGMEGFKGGNLHIDQNSRIIGDAAGAMRIGFEYTTGSYIVDDFGDGSTKVGGVLDLNKDGYWDYSVNGSEMKEVYYGESAAAPEHASEALAADSAAVDATKLDNCFFGASKAGVLTVDAEAKVQVTRNFASLGITKTDTLGALEAYDAENAAAPTMVKVTIWAEGWDHDCVNGIMSLSSIVSLVFINK